MNMHPYPMNRGAGKWSLFAGMIWLAFLMTHPVHAQTNNPCSSDFAIIDDVCLSTHAASGYNTLYITDQDSLSGQHRRVVLIDPSGIEVWDHSVRLNKFGDALVFLEWPDPQSGDYEVRYYCQPDIYSHTLFAVHQGPEYFIHETPIACEGSEGEISLLPARGQQLTYLWSTGSDLETLSHLDEGTYGVTITNQFGCRSIEEFQMIQPDPIEVDLHVSAYDCNGQVDSLVFLDITGGVGPYSVDWSMDGRGDYDDPAKQVTMKEGLFQVSIKDAVGCVKNLDVQIIYDGVKQLKDKTTTISPLFTLDHTLVYDLMSTVDVQYGDIDNDGKDGTVLDVSFHSDSVMAVANMDKLPEMFASDSVGSVYARVETIEGCFVVSRVDLVDQRYCLLQSEACDNDAPIELVPIECDPTIIYLPSGGTFEVFKSDPSGLTPVPSRLICDPMTGSCYFDPTDGSGNYQINYTYDISGTATTRIAFFDVQDVNPQIDIGFDSICASDLAFRIYANPDGGYMTGAGIVDSFTAALQPNTKIYVVDPSQLSFGGYSSYTYTYSQVNFSGRVCQKKALDSIFVSEPVYIDIQAQETSVCSLSTVYLSALNARGPIERIEWFDPSGSSIATGSNATFNATTEGLYKVVAYGSQGCLDSAEVDISLFELPVLSCSIQAQVTCPGGSDAVAELEIIGATDLAGYTIAWSNGGTSLIQNNLSSGTYHVTVTTPSGCIDSCDLYVGEPATMQIECGIELHPVSCFGGRDGIDSVHASGGTPPYMYSLDGGPFQNEPVFSGVSGGGHRIYILDSRGCQDSCDYIKNEPPMFDCQINKIQDALCTGTATGSAQVFITGGVPDFSVLWSTGDTSRLVSGLSVGDYSVVVMDANGCRCSSNVSISEPQPLNLQCRTDSVSCHGLQDGGIRALVSGGTPPYSFLWSDGQTTPTAINLMAGDYGVRVTDANGCMISCTTTVFQPTDLNLACTGDELLCFDDANGVVSVNVAGGTPPYSYQWSSGGTEATEDSLRAGVYEVTVFDANDCMAQCTAVVSQPLPLVIQLEEDSVCLDFGQTISSTIGGGVPPYSYQWTLLDDGNTGATSINLESPTDPDLYFNSFCLNPGIVTLGLSVEDGNGCQVFQEVNFKINCCFDLAVKKTVQQSTDYEPGDRVEFDVEVINQGSIDAFALVIEDSSQLHLTFDPSINTSSHTGNQEDWKQVRPGIFSTTIDHIPAGQSRFLKVNMNIDHDFTGFELTNYVAVVFYSNGVKDLPMDEDDLSARLDPRESNDDVDDDFNGRIDNPFDEDRKDFETVYLCSMEHFACNDLVNVSLDADGKAVITPDMVAENLRTPSSFITVTIRDANGNDLGNVLDCSHTGQVLEYSVYNACDGHTCWGNLVVEDKMGPSVNCARADTFYCHEEGANLTPDTLMDNCGGTISEVVISDETQIYDCDEPFARRRIIVKEYRDRYGNPSEQCVKEVYFKRYTTLDIQFPGDTIIECQNFVSAHPQFLGVPEVNGSPVYPMDASCSIAIKYQDDTLSSCGETFKIIRRWRAYDWCRPSGPNNPYHHTQIIKTVDFQGPQIYCPGTSAKVDTVSADQDCSGTFILPEPHILIPGQTITDSNAIYIISECSDYHYSVLHLPASNPSDCRPASAVPTDAHIVRLSNGRYQAVNVPFGCNWFYYTVVDDCGNETTCTFDIYVEDKTPPIAICDEHTTVSLNLSGLTELKATSVDNGSIDNCMIDTMLIRRMDGVPCGGPLGLQEKAIFCCEDLGKSIMVEFVVIDKNGNSNSCMVEVEVQNKIAPLVKDCPADITLNCTQDFTDLSLTGGSAVFEGVCPIAVSFDDVVDLDDCGKGTVQRTWTARYIDGSNMSTCVQTITLADKNPITQNRIRWPSPNIELTGCTEPDVTTTGVPVPPTGGCHDVLVTHSDRRLVREPGSCMKILRKWSVVDWCSFDITTGAGQWDFEQTINIKNNNKPTVQCNDQTVRSERDDCQASVVLKAMASDDCTDVADLKWKIEVDYFGDKTIDATFNANDVAIDMPVGDHMVYYTAEDGCENMGTCTASVHVVDGKNPTPICKSGIVTVVMEQTGQITVWASDLEDGKSFDNCTDSSDLMVSFSPDVSDVSRTYDCDSLQNGRVDTFLVNVWVTDEAGNQDFCTTRVIVQDNQSNVCTDHGNITASRVGGQIRSYTGAEIEEVSVVCNHPATGIQNEVLSANDGVYLFAHVPNDSETYVFSAQKSRDWLAGVSTRDLVIIQNHLLGAQLLTDPYHWISADINNDKKISVADISSLRRTLLGKTAHFPNGQVSWRCMKSDFQPNLQNPFDFPQTVEVMVDRDQQLDFTAVKIGDVDGSFEPLGGNDTRSLTSLPLYWERTDEGWSLMCAQDIDLLGGQWHFDVSDHFADVIAGVLDVEIHHWFRSSEGLRIVWESGGRAIHVPQNTSLFVIIDGSETSPRMDPNFRQEVYDDQLSTYDVIISPTNQGGGMVLYQNIPNPFDHGTQIPFKISVDSHVELSVFDADGRMIHEIKGYYSKGDHVLLIDGSQLTSTGVMYYKLQAGQQSEIRKMIKL